MVVAGRGGNNHRVAARWDESAIGLLPEYIKGFYAHLLKTFDSFAEELGPEKRYRREQTGNHYASTIQCYMKEHGTTIQETCQKLKELIEDAWKDMVEHCINPSGEQPLIVPQIVVNFARTVTNMYSHGDAFTSSHTIKEMIASLYVVPIQV
ncbi:hypothetical protein E2562_015211 [Oryza meyeriana var. granulata]|uniref:Terpene synthase metal-binding domain-containing protein n=1 Tax=Oryza meyeriana var. granulata TaxID=110450 RepID=A0A6G1EWU0_9ORYZ|nr:hypothetical protein E2562_015211 [Oryza meyeriana var. granulata]